MSYPSIDSLQQALARDVFHYAKDRKKAAGRALGTLVEVITFYVLKSWGLERHLAIERAVPEYANNDIAHNVEFTLHPSVEIASVRFADVDLPVTAKKMAKRSNLRGVGTPALPLKSNELLTSDGIRRNACTVSDLGDTFINAYIEEQAGDDIDVRLHSLTSRPFAAVECKRVGVEDGMRTGPQTIEKAKQGAYVARAVSSLQRVRLRDGRLGGLMQRADGNVSVGDYYDVYREVVMSGDADELQGFVLTVGVVSNHGNWFTSEDMNKELRVLAQSYDWLLFLSDEGIARFVRDLLLEPSAEFAAARVAFQASYTGSKGKNRFTKVRMGRDADLALTRYFTDYAKDIGGWFSVISPASTPLDALTGELMVLRSKDWEAIHV